MIIYKQLTFDSAHRLDLPYESKCNQLHGHRYKIEIWISGEPNRNGMIIDFSEIKNVINNFDHIYLNDIIKNPTLELLVIHIRSRIASECNINLDNIKIRLWENESSYIEDGEIK